MSPNCAASFGEPALQPSVPTRLKSVSGPRVFETITSCPCLTATVATARATKPAPIVPILMRPPDGLRGCQAASARHYPLGVARLFASHRKSGQAAEHGVQ